jgi:hypothetical protein
MAGKPRIEYAGAVYHVMNRGDSGGRIFKDKLDYDLFIYQEREAGTIRSPGTPSKEA